MYVGDMWFSSELDYEEYLTAMDQIHEQWVIFWESESLCCEKLLVIYADSEEEAKDEFEWRVDCGHDDLPEDAKVQHIEPWEY